MSEALMRQNLVVVMQAYATTKGWSDATVSRRLHGDHQFLAKYRAEMVTLTIEKYFEIVAQIIADWPRDRDWPVTVAIPPLGEKLGKKLARAAK